MLAEMTLLLRSVLGPLDDSEAQQALDNTTVPLMITQNDKAAASETLRTALRIYSLQSYILLENNFGLDTRRAARAKAVAQKKSLWLANQTMGQRLIGLRTSVQDELDLGASLSAKELNNMFCRSSGKLDLTKVQTGNSSERLMDISTEWQTIERNHKLYGLVHSMYHMDASSSEPITQQAPVEHGNNGKESHCVHTGGSIGSVVTAAQVEAEVDFRVS